jgi:SAM-dependent methyltransferase
MTNGRSAPSWVAGFYDRKSEVAGPSGVLAHHRERATAIGRFGGVSKGRVLELGAGSGGAAVATGQLGYSVVAVEISPVRARYARELASEHRCGEVQVLEADFMSAEIDGLFDVVCYWNGFGVGSDADQRGLLARICQTWLTPDGVVILDVFDPYSWVRNAGTRLVDEETSLTQALDFDLVGNRFLDSWWFEGEEQPPLVQSLRCYSLADLNLLLEGTGLHVRAAEVDGVPLDRLDPRSTGPLADTWGYRVALVRAEPAH